MTGSIRTLPEASEGRMPPQDRLPDILSSLLNDELDDAHLIVHSGFQRPISTSFLYLSLSSQHMKQNHVNEEKRERRIVAKTLIELFIAVYGDLRCHNKETRDSFAIRG